MKKSILSLSVLALVGFAQPTYEFTPQLLIETGASQRLDTAQTGTLYLEKMEAGFEITIGEKLTAMSNLELCTDYAIELNEAKVTYAFTKRFALSAGRLVTNFGSFVTDAITDPRIKEPCETKQYALQGDFTGDLFYGGLSIYNGIISENFAACIPAVGIAVPDRFDIKLAARTELLKDKSFADLSLSGTFSPIKQLRFVGELYAELQEKPAPTDEDTTATTQSIGSMSEIDFYPSDKWELFSRFDHMKEKKGDMQTFMIQTGCGYRIAEQLRAALSVDMNGEKNGETALRWTPSLSAELKFEL